MAVPSPITFSPYNVKIGTVHLLTDDGHDFFPDGGEPQLSHSQAADTPDVAGLDYGLILPRGNTRWSITVNRVREFHEFAYPVTDGAITAADAAEYAQKWLLRH